MGAKVILSLSLIFDIILLINDVTTDVNLTDRLTMQFGLSGQEINPVLVASIIINLVWITLDVFAIIGISLKKPQNPKTPSIIFDLFRLD